MQNSLVHLFNVEPENDWRLKAACRGMDPEMFFTSDGFETKQERDEREVEAKSVCARCPVRAECLDYSIKAGERYGVWGGLNELERRSLVRRRHALASEPA